MQEKVETARAKVEEAKNRLKEVEADEALLAARERSEAGRAVSQDESLDVGTSAPAKEVQGLLEQLLAAYPASGGVRTALYGAAKLMAQETPLLPPEAMPGRESGAPQPGRSPSRRGPRERSRTPERGFAYDAKDDSEIIEILRAALVGKTGDDNALDNVLSGLDVGNNKALLDKIGAYYNKKGRHHGSSL